MAQLIAPDYNQQFLFPPALEDFVPADHPARFLREFVDQLDLPSLGFAMPAASEGRPPYAPSLLLKIWLYGYMRRIRTLRSLEAACREELSLLWLTGFLQPDHNTLWRFWRENKKALRSLFQSAAQLALKAGLVGLVLQAVDGTKIQAVASGRSGWSKEHMNKLLVALEKELEETEGQLEAEGEPAATQAYRLPESLQDKQALQEVVKSGLEQLQVTGRKHYHPEEPEALRMSCDGKNRFGYNAQVVVDEKAGVIVAADAVDQENDTGQLAPMVQQATEVVSQAGVAPVIVADSGYGAGTDIAKASECKLNVLVYPQEGQPSKGNPYHARHFRYEAQHQRVICPQDQELEFTHTTAQKGQTVRVYSCKHYQCPVRAQCTQEARGRRTIEIWPHTAAVQAMRARLKEDSAKEQLRRRGQIVERVFGQIKQHDGFRRWTVRGLESVRTQWAMICCAINLRVLYKQWKAVQPL